MSTKKKRLLFLNSISEESISYSNKIEVSSIPLIETFAKKLNLKDLNKNIPWIITSQSAARLIKKLPVISQKIYVVGKKTASHFKNAIYPKKNTALELAKLIELNQEKKVIFLCGDKRRDDLPNYLKSVKIELQEVVVYQSKIIDKNVNLYDYDALAFMSPSTVYAMAKNNGFGSLPCFAIGETTGEALNKHGQVYKISEEPNAVSLIKAAEHFLK